MQPSHYLPLLAQQFLHIQSNKLSEINLDNWKHMSEAIVGYRHRMNEQVCQDACISTNLTRPILVLSDGAGSSPVSDLGAQSLSMNICRLLISIEPLLVKWLDNSEADLELIGDLLNQLISRHAKGILKDLATIHKRDLSDFRATLLLCVVGSYNTYWFQVGDGYLAKRTSIGYLDKWEAINLPEKGEYANSTCFIDKNLKISQCHSGFIHSNQLTAIVAMSDGASEKLVCNRTAEVSNVMEWLYFELINKPIVKKTLLGFLSDPKIWDTSTGDDKSLAMLVR